MGLLERIMKQDAVYWQQLDQRDQYGQIQYALPVQIKCRWDRETLEMIDEKGVKVTSKSSVIIPIDIKPGDMLYEGTLESIESLTDSNESNDSNDSLPAVVAGAEEVIVFTRNPDIRAKKFVRTAYLSNRVVGG